MKKFLNRESVYSIEPLLLSRVSYRSFSEERLSEDELLSLFEAARWAPSSYNNQPWRFIYVRRGDPEWNLFFDALVEFNQTWCRKADTLVVILARNNHEHNEKPARTAQFDTGAAWMSLALEGHAKNILVHGMEGFDYDGIKKKLKIPDSYTVMAMCAIGKPGDKESLPEAIRKKEVPSTRKPLQDIISRGKFTFK
jgi:nitroreductase